MHNFKNILLGESETFFLEQWDEDFEKWPVGCKTPIAENCCFMVKYKNKSEAPQWFTRNSPFNHNHNHLTSFDSN